MMKNTALAILILMTFSYGTCKKEPTLPECISQKITEIKKQPKWNPPAQIDEYIYNGKRVYLFSSDCCDQYNQAFDENCNYICSPTGGIGGRGDHKCPDFAQQAKLVRTVWKDQR